MDPISELLPLLVLMPLLRGMMGMGGQPLKHSPPRNDAKNVLAGVTILGGLASAVAAPVILAIWRPTANGFNPGPVGPGLTLSLLQQDQANWNVALYTKDLTWSIGAGIGCAAKGTSTILEKA